MNSIEQYLLTSEMEDVLHQAERALKKTAAPARAVTYKDAIIIGDPSDPLYTFDTGNIIELSLVTGVDVVGSELSVDQLTPTVVYFSGKVLRLWGPKGYQGLRCSDGRIFAYRVPRPDLRLLPYGTPVRYLRDNALVGKYYSLNVARTAKDFYKVNAVSPIGLLGKTQHLGGIYAGETFLEVVTDIIGGVVPFSCAPDVGGLKVYGWLPILSRRDALHQLCFAYGVSVRRDGNGDIYFDYIAATDDPKQVPDGRIYYGGSVDYSTPATGVEVTEHSYSQMAAVEPVTLFDNTDAASAANNTMVPFDQAPVFGLATTGSLQIVSSGVNYAVVTGVGTLTGKPYVHTSRIISMTAPDADQLEANVVRVTDATLVNLTNSHNVAQRVMDYYSSAKTISAAIYLEGEAAGDQVALSDPFGEPSTGFLQRLEINVSSNLKANCTIVTDYAPKPERPTFTSVTHLTGEGDYVVPAGVYLIRVAMIQGGQGGSKGNAGAQGGANRLYTASGTNNQVKSYFGGDGGEGGEPGAPGGPGKVYVVDIPVTPGQVFHFKCGSPGQGGLFASGTGAGQEGGHSTFGPYSSSAGIAYQNGWVETLSGTVYATPGKAGIKGGKGSGIKEGTSQELVPGNSITVDGHTWTPGASYVDKLVGVEDPYGYFHGSLTGSQGGGAAYGANGSPGSEPYAKAYDNDSAIWWLSTSGRWGTPPSSIWISWDNGSRARLYGGRGANAQPFPAETLLGRGGPGGNGGGGGGAGASGGGRDKRAGGSASSIFNQQPPLDESTRSPGGAGSDGSPGGPGGILVYV